MRGKRPSLAAFAVAGLVLAQLAGCGGCVKDDPKPQPVSTAEHHRGRKPINLKAADGRLTQFSDPDGQASVPDASRD